MRYTRETFLDPKMIIYSNYITIVGFECLYEGKRLINNIIEKIL